MFLFAKSRLCFTIEEAGALARVGEVMMAPFWELPGAVAAPVPDAGPVS